MAVSKSTLTTDTWDVLYTYLQTTNAISTNNIFSAYNSTLAVTKGYPLVIIHPPVANISKLTVGGQLIQSEVSVEFALYHTSSQNLKVLKDNVTDKLMDGRATFAGEGLKRMDIEDGGFDNWSEGKKKRHVYEFTVTFFFVD